MYRAILLAYLVAGSCASLTIGPENKAVIQGTTVIMKCLTNNESEKVFWRRQNRGEVPDKISISNRVSPHFSEVYRVNNSLPGQYDLIIRTDLSTGNQYICQEGSHGLEDGSFLSAELVVLESEPRCDINISSSVNNMITVPVNSSLQLHCTVRYSGNWEPITEWKMLNSTVVIHYVVERTVLNDSVSLTTILTTAYDAVIHGGRYVYELRFDESKRPNSTTATNIPDYEYTWMSPTISMTFPQYGSAIGGSEQILWLIVFLTILVVLLFFITLILMVKKWRLKQPRIALDIIREASESHESVQNVNNRTLQNEYDHPGPPYAVIATMQSQQSVSRPEYSQQNQIPIYASVRNSKQMSESTQCLMDSNYNSPPSSEVDMSRKREKQLEFPNAAFQQEVHFPESSKVIGFDGTEYAQLQPPANEAISFHAQGPRKQLFETSDYAKIDHTLTVPKIRRNLR